MSYKPTLWLIWANACKNITQNIPVNVLKNILDCVQTNTMVNMNRCLQNITQNIPVKQTEFPTNQHNDKHEQMFSEHDPTHSSKTYWISYKPTQWLINLMCSEYDPAHTSNTYRISHKLIQWLHEQIQKPIQGLHEPITKIMPVKHTECRTNQHNG